MSITGRREILAGVPVLLAAPAPSAEPPPPVLWFHGYRADAAANEAELVRIAEAGFLAVGVDAAGHGARADGDPDERIPSHPGGALGVMLELAAATLDELPALLAALADARLAAPGPAAAVGVSMGGFIAYRAPLVAPAVRTVVALLGSPHWPHSHDEQRLPDVLRDVSLLSVTAEHDANVPPAAARQLHAALPPGAHEYLELPGAGHLMTAGQWERAMESTVGWLRRHHGRASSARRTDRPRGRYRAG